MTYQEITQPFTYDEIIGKINNHEPFSLSRWGDGEFNCIYRDRGQMNSDLHKYFPELGSALLDVLKSSPPYHIALQNLAYRQKKGYIQQLTKNYDLVWNRAAVFHNQSAKAGVDDLVDALRGREVVLVGPEHVAKMDIWDIHIIIPLHNVWLAFDEVMDAIAEQVQPGVVIVYCAGMPANVMIDRNYRDDITQIDCGSVFDPYCGVNSRGYHFDMPGAEKNESSEYFKRRGR